MERGMERMRRRRGRIMRRLLHQRHHHHPRNLQNRKVLRLLIPKPKLQHAHFLILPPHLQQITNLLAHHRLLPLRPLQQRKRVERKPMTKWRSLLRQSPKKEKNLLLYQAQLLSQHRQMERKKKEDRQTARRRNERVNDFEL